LYPAGRRPWNFTPKFTFDGFANLMSFGTGQGVEGYSQIFRNGAIETVNAAVLEQSPNRDTHFYWLELLTMDCAERMLKIMDLLQISGPYYLLLSLLNVKGLRMAAGGERHYNRDVRVIDQPHLIVPEVLLQTAPFASKRKCAILSTCYGMHAAGNGHGVTTQMEIFQQIGERPFSESWRVIDTFTKSDCARINAASI
jgi:hypothetical protein